ncbi:hypothetical protein [Bacillus methanolicus]|nr:hypothetical protein [Bacillus methanolicus]
MDIERVFEEKYFLIGRLFTLGGTVLLLIGAIISVIISYRAYVHAINS